MHVPEEGQLASELGRLKRDSEDQGAPDEVLDAAGEPILPHAVMTATTIIREAYAQGAKPADNVMLTIAEVQELCNLATQYPHPDGDGMVLGPEVFTAGDVISWQGENYYKRQVTDKDRELIAKNAKASIERRDRERAERLLREMAMHHAVEIHKAGLSAGHIPTKSLTDAADDILKWLTTTAE